MDLLGVIVETDVYTNSEPGAVALGFFEMQTVSFASALNAIHPSQTNSLRVR